MCSLGTRIWRLAGREWSDGRDLSATLRNLRQYPVGDGESMEIFKQGSDMISFALRKKKHLEETSYALVVLINVGC